MHETTKAGQRRKVDPFFTKTVFVGNALDIGPGPDLLGKHGEYPLLNHVTAFDKEQGNAEMLDAYFPNNAFQIIHASQALEHMEDPCDALLRWIRVCNKGGYLVISIPDFNLYEKRLFPSRFNADHRAFFTIWRDPNLKPHPKYIVVEEWLHGLRDFVAVERCGIVDTNYNYQTFPEVDQTMHGAEAFIEFVLRKL